MTTIDFGGVRAWLFEHALPLWAQKGVDVRSGGFLEELDLKGRPTLAPFKRVRTMCRQTYVFSHAASLGWSPGVELSRRGYDYLCASARLGKGQWAKVLTRDGKIADEQVDLYDHAFVILAMAWRYHASGDEAARLNALETLSFIQSRLRASDGGFLHTYPVVGARVQNPHMHLAEACLAAFKLLDEEVFLDVARETIFLMRDKFFDGHTLGERFEGAWRRIDLEVEPGHHFEWVWILAQFGRITGEDVLPTARALNTFAERVGINPLTRAVHDVVNTGGGASRPSSRVWPTTERLKAALGMFELASEDTTRSIKESLQVLRERFFVDCQPGLWVDQIDDQGLPLTHTVPASCLYHLFLAFAELLRLEPQLAKLDQEA